MGSESGFEKDAKAHVENADAEMLGFLMRCRMCAGAGRAECTQLGWASGVRIRPEISPLSLSLAAAARRRQHCLSVAFTNVSSIIFLQSSSAGMLRGQLRAPLFPCSWSWLGGNQQQKQMCCIGLLP